MRVKIVGKTILATTRNKVITINPKQGKNPDLRSVARLELKMLGYRCVSDWKGGEALFQQVKPRIM